MTKIAPLFILFTVLFLNTNFVFSFPQTPYHLFEHIETQTHDGVILKGIKLPNPSGKRVLLLHGFGENTRIYRELAYLLHNHGYEVIMFNMRGHGNGSQKSLHPNVAVDSETGLYSFDNWVSFDVPAVLKYSMKGTKEKITVVGHSLGGAALRIFLSGVRGKLEKSDTLSAKMYLEKDLRKIHSFTSRIDKLIAIGSPTQFLKDRNLKFILWSKLPEFIQTQSVSLFAMKKETHSEPHGKRPLEVIQEGFHRTIHITGGYDGLVGNGFSFSDAEMARAFRKAFTHEIPIDLIQNVNHWVIHDFKSYNFQTFQKITLSPQVRFIQIVAEDDGLAPAKRVISDTFKYQFHYNPEIHVMSEHQHIDMISGKSGALRVFSVLTDREVEFEDMKPYKKRKKTLTCKNYFL